MSEYINNRELRKNTIKNIVRQLHEGKTVDEVKKQFDDVFKGVSASEISEAEAALVMEGVPVEEIQRLCDVHASVFKGSIEEIHRQDSNEPAYIPGHPVNILILENKKIEKMIDTIRSNLNDMNNPDSFKNLAQGIDNLLKINIHYNKKENLMFPYMEKYRIDVPPKVMWGVDDEIRTLIKDIKDLLSKSFKDKNKILQKIEEMIQKVQDMIFKEENIMVPMLLEKLTQDEWKAISDESNEFGFLIDNVPSWTPQKVSSNILINKESKTDDGLISLPTGVFKVNELEAVLNTLPFDVTFVDKNDVVKYFSQGKERIFPRTKSIIGRDVANCHPPASVHIVEKIVEDFKSNKKDNEDFWINMGSQFVFIRYFAVRNEKKEYLGVLEVTQNVKHIQELTGEKRLVSE